MHDILRERVRRVEGTDCTGQARYFVFSYFPLQLGFGVHAEEDGKDGRGYFFREFDAISPYLALGRLRGRIYEALATRHIEEHEPGNFQTTHRTVRGRISYDDGQVAFVIDGHRPQEDLATEKPHRRRGASLAATVPITTETQAAVVRFRKLFTPTAWLAWLVGTVQSPAAGAALLPSLGGEFLIDPKKKALQEN